MNESNEDAWQAHMREAMGLAVAAFMDYSNSMYRDAINENERLRERVKYLETRVAELERPRP